MDEENINAPVTESETRTMERRPPEDTVLVVVDNCVVDVKPNPEIKNWGKDSWYKELVITYTLEQGTSSAKKLASDRGLITSVWNNMAKHYRAFLKDVNTQKQTLRFSLLKEEDFKRLLRKVVKFPEELQKVMFKGTGSCSEDLQLKATAKSSTLDDGAFTDSGLDTDIILTGEPRTKITSGKYTPWLKSIHTSVKGMKEDLDEIKQSILKLQTTCFRSIRHVPVQRRNSRSHSNDKHRRSRSGNHFRNSTDEDDIFTLKELNFVSNGVSEMSSDAENVLCTNNSSNQQNQPTDFLYNHRHHRNGKRSFRRFQEQEKPGVQLLRIEHDNRRPRHRRKESNVLSDEDFNDERFDGKTFNQKTKTKWKPDNSKHKKKVPGHLQFPSTNSIQKYYGVTGRSGVKVLNPRQGEQQPRSAAPNQISQNKPLGDADRGRGLIFDRGEPIRHQMQTDKEQKADKEVSRQDYHTQQENTRRKEHTEDGWIDDKMLLEMTISEMESRGDVNLENDGINAPNQLLQDIVYNENGKTENNDGTNQSKPRGAKDDSTIQRVSQNRHDHSEETVILQAKIEENKTLVAGASLSLENADVTTSNSKLDEVLGTSENDMEFKNDVNSMTQGESGSSMGSGVSFQPDVDPETLLQRVGLHLNEPLIQLLDENLKSIENNGQEAKGNGIDTVLVVDASSSMDEKSFSQMKSACLNILEFVETVAAEKSIEENLALVVFGRNPKILQHLTIDYRKLYDKIENIDSGGSSPMCIGMLLSMLELHIRGGATSIARYQIPPRVILMTDGRPTDDNRFQHHEIEFGVKSPTVKENVLLAMDEMRHYGYQVICVPVGQAVNRVCIPMKEDHVAFLADMVQHANGCIAEIDDLSSIKKHFLCHYTIAKVIGICRDLGWESKFKDVIKTETAALLSSALWDVSFTPADVVMITAEIEKSEDLNDKEYPELNLPPIGSRVSSPLNSQIPNNGISNEYGTVIQQRSNGMIKVEWDAGIITSLDYGTDRNTLGLRILPEPRLLTQGALIEVGVAVVKAQTDSKSLRGRVFLTTNNGFVKVRWDNGEIGRYKYGADATFDLYIALESYPMSAYIWQHEADNGDWELYPLEDLQKIENAYVKSNKTVTTRSGRIVFSTFVETLARDTKKKRSVRRITVSEMRITQQTRFQTREHVSKENVRPK